MCCTLRTVDEQLVLGEMRRSFVKTGDLTKYRGYHRLMLRNASARLGAGKGKELHFSTRSLPVVDAALIVMVTGLVLALPAAVSRVLNLARHFALARKRCG